MTAAGLLTTHDTDMKDSIGSAATMLDQYERLTRHIVPGPQDICYFMPMILLPIALLIPRSVLGRQLSIAIFMPCITICTLRAWIVMEGVDVISVNTLLWSAFLIALEDPWKHYRLVTPIDTRRKAGSTARTTGLRVADRNGSYAEPHSKDSDQKSHTTNAVEQGYPSDLGARMIWVGKLLAAIRLDNWKIGRVSHDRLQPPRAGFSSRRQFLLRSLLSLVRAMLLIDLTSAYIQYDEYFVNPSVSLNSPLPFEILWFFPPRMFRSIIAGAQAYALIGECFYLPAAFPVMLNGVGLLPNRYSPHTWPVYFGSPVSIFMHGIRGFWGSFWHQTMRWSTSGPGYAIADALDLKQGSILRYAAISLSAFGFSGVVHMGLVPPEPLSVRTSVAGVRLSMAGFFWSQAVAVLLEAIVAKAFVGRDWRQGNRKAIRVIVNGVWTVMWFSMSLPLLMDAARQLGYWTVWPLPVSAWQWWHGRGWSTWS